MLRDESWIKPVHPGRLARVEVPHVPAVTGCHDPEVAKPPPLPLSRICVQSPVA